MNTAPDTGLDQPDARAGEPQGTKPFAAFEWLLARRYLGTRRKETFISVISAFSFVGIMLGVATLMVVMAVMNGFRTELLNRILGVNGHIIVQPSDLDLTDYAEVAKRIEGVEGVTLAIPLIEGQVLASGDRNNSGALVRGIREQDITRISAVADNVKNGTLEGFDEANGVAIGFRMAENLGLSVGSYLTLVSPNGNVTPLGVTPRVKGYKVQAIFEVGMSEYDSSFVFMTMKRHSFISTVKARPV